MPEDDLVVELLHYDPDGYRLEHAIRDGEATVEAVEPLTHDIVAAGPRAPRVRVHSRPVRRPVGARRDGRPAIVLDGQPARRRSDRADDQALPGRPALGNARGRRSTPGRRLGFTGPYGSLRVRDSERPILMIAGGSGMAPVLSLLRQLARSGARVRCGSSTARGPRTTCSTSTRSRARSPPGRLPLHARRRRGSSTRRWTST